MNGGSPKNIQLLIVNDPDGDGDHWRILNLAGGTLPFNNPQVDQGDTITWLAPGNIEAAIVLLNESPLKDGNQAPVPFGEVIDIPAGGLGPYTVEDPDHPNQKTYEYAAIVKDSNGQTQYVSGQNSPPGIIVEPHP
jgi:hypothetical protein